MLFAFSAGWRSKKRSPKEVQAGGSEEGIMYSTKRALWAFLILLPLLTGGSVFAFADDDDATDDVQARVARLSFIRGDVQVRRTGNKDWEKAALNLPVVEGDEISVGNDSRTEIQIDSTSYLRLNGRAYL